MITVYLLKGKLVNLRVYTENPKRYLFEISIRKISSSFSLFPLFSFPHPTLSLLLSLFSSLFSFFFFLFLSFFFLSSPASSSSGEPAPPTSQHQADQSASEPVAQLASSQLRTAARAHRPQASSGRRGQPRPG